MPRLLVQCQGSPNLPTFEMTQLSIDAILQRYHCIPTQGVLIIQAAPPTPGCYYINLAMVSWMCVTDESEAKPDYTPAGTGLSRGTLSTIGNVIQDVRDNIIHRQHETNPRPNNEYFPNS